MSDKGMKATFFFFKLDVETKFNIQGLPLIFIHSKATNPIWSLQKNTLRHQTVAYQEKFLFIYFF